MSKYFTDDDTQCHCGCGFNAPDDLLMEMLDRLQERVGLDRPLELTNVCRCPEHNAEVGGVPDSQHTQGTAADVVVPDDMTVDELADIALEIGFDGVGRYYEDEFVHVDVRDGGSMAGCYQWTDDD